MKKELAFPRVSYFFGDGLKLADFEFVRTLGKGSYGHVGLYRHRASQRDYAIKKIQLSKPLKISRQDLETMTKKQIEILYKLDNDIIIKLLDHFEDENSVYLITEFVDGTNLYEIALKNGIRLPTAEVADIILQCCCGLEALHDSHIIHRDIKLENIMYNNSKIKIVDLGCSNFYGTTIPRKTTIGTRLYYSPEILLQEEQNDRLDIWCLGVVLYELIFLQCPFNDPEMDKKIRKIQYSFPEGPMDPDLRDLFQKIFTSKNERISASEMKAHPWIMSTSWDDAEYCRDKLPKVRRFQDYFTEYEVENYRELLEDHIEKEQAYLSSLQAQSHMLEGMLRQANRELKQLRAKKKDSDTGNYR